jgi:iterative type I PKS product template protein
LVISGVLSLEDALGIVVGRAQLMVDLCAVGKTGMMVCDKGAPHIEQLIDENRLTALSVACDNTPSSCVVSGGGEELDDLQRVLKALGIRCKRLDVPLGFHSSALDPILEPLERMCQRIQFHAPRIPLGACPYGRCLQEQDCGPEYIVQQTRSKVRFTDLIHSIRHHESLGNSPVFIEMGPHAITVPMLKSTLQDTESLYLGSLTKGQGEWLTLSTCLHQISERGYPVRWREVFDGSGARLVDAPAYPFQTQDLYVPFTESKRETSSNTSREKPKTFNLLTGYRSEDTAEIPSRFESNLGHVSPYVLGHVVGKTPLCPASVYHGMVLEAVHWDERENAGHSLVVADITFSSPLVYTPEVQNNMILMAFEGDMPTVSRLGKATARQFIFTSQAHPGSGTSTERNALCTGWAYWESLESLKLEFARDSAYVQRQIRHLQAQQSTASVFRTKTLYSTVFPRVVSYSDLYQSIQEISVLEDRLEAYGRFRIPKESHSDGIVSPVFLDTLLHAAGYVANIHVAHTDACICTQVETSTLIYQEIARNSEFQLYCSLFDCYDGVLLGEAYAIAEDGTIIASVKGMHFKRLNLNSFQRHLAHSLHGSSGGQTEHPTLKAEASTRGTGDANLPQSHYQQTSPAAAQQTQPSRSLEETVTRSLAEVCQPLASNVHRETHLSNLGLDSMMQIELATSLQNQIPDLRLDMERISRLETVQQLVEYIEQESGSSVPSSGPTLTQTTLSALGEKLGQPNGIKATGPDLPMSDLAVPPQGYLTPQSSSTPRSGSEDSDDNTSQCEARIPLDQSLILLQKGAESQPPLILFHDGSGMIEHYKKIHDMVCTVFAVKNPILRETHWATSLSDMAQQYSLAIASAIASPVVLGGMIW